MISERCSGINRRNRAGLKEDTGFPHSSVGRRYKRKVGGVVTTVTKKSKFSLEKKRLNKEEDDTDEVSWKQIIIKS